mmetsp:Transcript_14985/g.36515  ORF Transcript_14985/g.36515 Transcript_14985/m.36515 type:complete len:1046 (+) Transcript_14985:8-3145(+)
MRDNMWQSRDVAREVPSDAESSFSVSSTFRHTGNYNPPQHPHPRHAKDAEHKPKTHGLFGVMVVGLGGANGTTMLAGILTNRSKIDWRGPRGEPMSPNYNGCITQLDQRGVHGGAGYRDLVSGLADASMAAVGGWDIRPTKPGDALLEAQILDYDLVRQVRDEMNNVKIFRGLFDPRFIGSSQHNTATYILTEQEARSDSDALKCLRADIRYFKWKNGVVGHTTVIWSASVEPNSEVVESIQTAEELLMCIDMTEEERGGPLPPSILYATAALLEGCSFVNGGSQNTLSCLGLAELAQQQLGVYCLGTDFKAGQTKFKTAAVEYIRTMGLTPKVIASSNHLGNNDMRNLASAKAASSAKLKVKHDIFAPWEEEDLDHKVSIMFTPFINDEKRDFVEYTSLGFLGQPHTMVTYTRASDSVLCVPLMIDAAVWCDYFSGRSWPFERVAKALAYLFKVPEGGAKGVDPGFFKQMEVLKSEVLEAHESKKKSKRRVRIIDEEKATEWAIPHDARVICAGLACVDMQLSNSTGGDGGEGIETFEGEKSIGGGSVSMACKTIARLCHGEPTDRDHMQTSPPVVSSVLPLCMIGNDDTGNKLLALLEKGGATCRNVDTRVCRSNRSDRSDIRTALAVLPIYRDGRRGCFFDAASNDTFSPEQVIKMLGQLSTGTNVRTLQDTTPVYGALLFGYPHLLPLLQGDALARVFHSSRKVMLEGGIVALDLNGVPGAPFVRAGSLRDVEDLRTDEVIGAALQHVDILHMNEDELELLTGCQLLNTAASVQDDEFAIAKAADLFLKCGVAVVAVTRGKKGSYVACNNGARFQESPLLPTSWVNCAAHIPAALLPPGTLLNTNGAGDSFVSGLLVAAMLRHTGMDLPPTPTRKEEVGRATEEPITPPRTASPGGKKATPYSLYIRENYMSLKQQYHDDKKAIFERCHQMWEHETPDVKYMFERMAQEENEEPSSNANALDMMSDVGALQSQMSDSQDDAVARHYSTDESLSLESAVTFAGLVAAHHVDMSTRDLAQLDVHKLIEKAAVFSHPGRGMSEI